MVQSVCPSCEAPLPDQAVSCPQCGQPCPKLVPLSDPLVARLRGALADRYTIEREVGEGAMAVVYLGTDLRLGRPVALKVLRPDLSRMLGAERFLREIRIAATLTHPNILPLHDSGEVAGLLYYVMPYVEGDTVRARLARDITLPVDEAVRIAAEVADGLHHAHVHSFVHRDIKPENILLEEGHAAIADFGIAHAAAGTDVALTTGYQLGTPAYMSPEQADPKATTDHRADIYALGCTLYEMLTGHQPFPGPTMSAMVVQHATWPPPSARKTRREVSLTLDAVVERAMAKRPADRYATAEVFREALLASLEGRRRWRSWPVLRAIGWRRAAVVAGIIGAASLAVRMIGRGPEAGVGAVRTRVVVPYFADRTGRNRALADALTEQVIRTLQDVPALAVPPPPALNELRGAEVSAVRARFPSDYVLWGVVDTAAGGVRASLEVLRTSDGLGVGLAEALVADVAAVAAAGEVLTDAVSASLAREIDLADRRARVRDPQIWALLMRADALADEAKPAIVQGYEQEAFRLLGAADSLLQIARRRGAGNAVVALARAQLARQRAFYAEYARQNAGAVAADDDPGALRRRALADLEAFIGSHPVRADLMEMRGGLRDDLYGEASDDSLLAGAIADFETARSLDPGRASAWVRLAAAYRNAGRYAQALYAAERASALDALRIHTADLLRVRFDAAFGVERFDMAESACRSGLARWPSNQRFRDCLVQLWSRAPVQPGNAARAAAMHDSLRATDASMFYTDVRATWLAGLLARAGQPERADRLAAGVNLDVEPRARALLLLNLAWVRVARHDPDSARTLVDAAEHADPATRALVGGLAWLRALRDEAVPTAR